MPFTRTILNTEVFKGPPRLSYVADVAMAVAREQLAERVERLEARVAELELIVGRRDSQ